MKTTIAFICFLFTVLCVDSAAQTSCDDLIDYVKSNSYGTTYTSYTSTAISKVTFYNVTIDYKSYYFAIVCFKREYSYSCNEYIYQVGSNTKFNYAMAYNDSAGKAFWKYIEPYSDVLGCSPDFD